MTCLNKLSLTWNAHKKPSETNQTEPCSKFGKQLAMSKRE